MSLTLMQRDPRPDVEAPLAECLPLQLADVQVVGQLEAGIDTGSGPECVLQLDFMDPNLDVGAQEMLEDPPAWSKGI